MTRIWSRSWSRSRLLMMGVCLSSLSLAACATLGETQPQPAPEMKPPRLPTPAEETDSALGSVRRSGPIPADIQPVLQKAAVSAFADTFGPNTDLVHTEVVGCFASGCLFQVTYRDRCVQRASKHDLFTDAAGARLRTWPGGISQTPPVVLSDGRIQVTWALLISDAPERRARLEGLLGPAPVARPIIVPDVCTATKAAPIQERPPMQGTIK